MKIENTEVFGYESAMRVMLYPMKSAEKSTKDNDFFLANKLASCKPASGHDSMLKGIIVKADWTADHSFWLQEGRYHFIDIASSASKMHTVCEGSIRDFINPLVAQQTILFVEGMIQLFNSNREPVCHYRSGSNKGDVINIENKKQLFEAIIMNLPIGYELKAGIVTNYLQLKNMYNQRKNHRMSAWSIDFKRWVESLPNSSLIIGR